jgi:tRNA(Ile)-lysidine synthase
VGGAGHGRLTAVTEPADVPLGPLPAGCGRDGLVAAVRAALDDAHLRDGAAAVVALSGGPDSTALAYLVAEARPDLTLTLAHVRHGLRDDRADVEVVRQHASWLGLPLEVREVEVVVRGRGLEDAAREARYAALRGIAAASSAEVILLGHTADDQAETVLLRAARGTGLAGLAGMATVRDDLVRPLLRLRRADLRRFVELEGLPSAEDPTNTDPAVRRTIVRHELLPLLARAGPDPVGALGRLADLAREDGAALDRWAGEVVDGAVRRIGPVVAVPDEALAAVPVAVARRVVRQLAATLTGPPTAADVVRVLGLAAGQLAHLPDGLRASAGGGWRALYHDPLPTAEEAPLSVPGTTPWPPAAVQLTSITPDTAADAGDGTQQIAFELPEAWTPPTVRLDATVLPPGGVRRRLRLALPGDLPPLRVRHRRPGDRIATAAGTQRLQDLLVDAGVPRPIRSLWPVVTAGDRPVWIPGIAADAQLLEAGHRAPRILLVCERLPRRTTR